MGVLPDLEKRVKHNQRRISKFFPVGSWSASKKRARRKIQDLAAGQSELFQKYSEVSWKLQKVQRLPRRPGLPSSHPSHPRPFSYDDG